MEKKSIAKNTFYLYAKSIISLCISLYTSRAILVNLGVEDFGIWNVVAGVVAMFSFLEASMSGASSRFLTFEMGKGDLKSIRNVFNSSLHVHFFVGVLIVLLAETIGLYFFKTKLIIPETRFATALFIYQSVVLTSFITVMKVPFIAAIMASERMKIFACVEILYSLMKLTIVVVLGLVHGDKLFTYGILNLSITLVIFCIYIFTCKKRFKFCTFSVHIHDNVAKKMVSFSGWDLFSNMSVMARSQGINMLLNMFFGVALNAASGIATQVQGVVLFFGRNLFDAARPRIIKNYSNGHYLEMVDLIYKTSQYTTLILLLLSIPLLVEIPYVLKLWLNVVPDYASSFCRFVLLFNLMANIFFPVTIGIHATGKIKEVSCVSGLLYIMVIPFTYFGYRMGFPPQVAYAFNLFAAFIAMFLNIFILKKHVQNFSRSHFLLKVVLKCFSLGTMDFILVLFVSKCLEASFLRLVLSTTISSSFLFLVAFQFVLNTEDRLTLMVKLRLKKK